MHPEVESRSKRGRTVRRMWVGTEHAVLKQNHDLCYAYSPLEDGFPGARWLTADGTTVRHNADEAIVPRSETVAFPIPKHSGGLQLTASLNSGILNQEAQCLLDGEIHVLNRENVDGISTW